LSYGLWQRRFGSDPSVVCQTVSLNGHPVTVIGVAREGFTGLIRGLSIDLWVPLMMQPQLMPGLDLLKNRGTRGLKIIGRLKPGVSVEPAQANVRLLGQQLHKAYPDNWRNFRGEARVVSVLPESQSRVFPEARGPVLGFMGLLMAVVGLVLLIACANVANLLLGRATARRKEMAIRLSLGASRLRLMCQLLTESLLLSVLAGAAGVLMAAWATDLLMAFQPPLPVTLALDLGLDHRVLGFTLGLSLVTGVLFGLAPALHASKAELVVALKDEGAGAPRGYRRSRLRSLLVISQVAVSLLLLIGSGLFLRSLANAHAIDPGFDPENVLLVSVDLGLQGYSEAKGKLFFEQLQERLKALPQVQSTSTAYSLPLGLGGGRTGIAMEGYQPSPGEDMEIHFNVVGPGYFETMRIPIVRGRSFTEQDRGGAPGVVIVNEAVARRYWPGQDAIGKHMSWGWVQDEGQQTYPLEVIGIAKDGKYVTLGEDPRPFVYFPHLQNYEAAMTVLVRTAGNPKSLVDAVRNELRTLDPHLPAFDIKTLTEHLGVTLLPVRMAATLLGLFSVLALVLAAVGIYGVVSYSVSQRTHELGIRLALGAQARDVLKLVIAQGMSLTLIGVAMGLAAAFGVTRFLTFLLYGISPTDPLTFAGISVLLAAVALLASYVPARRATKVDPMVALRYE